MAFKMKGFPKATGVGGLQAEKDLKKELSADDRVLGGSFEGKQEGMTTNPSFRDKMRELDRKMKEMKEGGATDAEVAEARRRGEARLKANIKE